MQLLGKDCYDIDIALDNMLGSEFVEKVKEYLLSKGEEVQGLAVIPWYVMAWKISGASYLSHPSKLKLGIWTFKQGETKMLNILKRCYFYQKVVAGLNFYLISLLQQPRTIQTLRNSKDAPAWYMDWFCKSKVREIQREQSHTYNGILLFQKLVLNTRNFTFVSSYTYSHSGIETSLNALLRMKQNIYAWIMPFS